MNDSLYKQMLENFYEGVYFVDKDRTITFWNKGAERISGYTAEEILGSHCYDNILIHVDELGNRLCFNGCPLLKTIEDGLMREAPVYLHHKDGHRVAVSVRTIPLYEDGKVIGAVEVFTDHADKVSEQKNLQELKALAMRDQLTGLPNRRYLEQLLENKWREFQVFEKDFGLLFMDIDHFKAVNDNYGHHVGDEILQMVAKSTRAGLRRGDMVGRWGGEEFLIIVDEPTIEGVTTVAQKIRMLIENSSIAREGQEINVTVSLGAALASVCTDLNEMIKKADEMMYESKRNGRNRVTVYSIS